MYEDQRYIEYNRPLIQQVNKRIYDIIESKNKRWVEVVIDFLSKYNRFVIGGNLDYTSETSIFRILHCLIGKMDLISEL
jgi:hypothetical protein